MVLEMEKSKLSNETKAHIEEIASVKGITVEEAIIKVLNQCSKKHAGTVRRANWASDRVMNSYNDDVHGRIKYYFIP